MSDTWFEDTLLPSDTDFQATTKALPWQEALSSGIERRLRYAAQGIVRVQNPRWRKPTIEEGAVLLPRAGARMMIVRLAFEFDMPADAKRENVRFISAQCLAYLWAAKANQPQPIVYDLVPRDLREGEPRKVTVNFEPQITLANVVGVGLGGISSDVNVGMVEPVCVGFTGKDSREPYWDLRPKGQSLLGIRSFWLIVEVPDGCDSFRLTARAQAEVQGFFGILPLTGKNTTREALPSVLIPVP